MRACVRACVLACARACVRACVWVSTTEARRRVRVADARPVVPDYRQPVILTTLQPVTFMTPHPLPAPPTPAAIAGPTGLVTSLAVLLSRTPCFVAAVANTAARATRIPPTVFCNFSGAHGKCPRLLFLSACSETHTYFFFFVVFSLSRLFLYRSKK